MKKVVYWSLVSLICLFALGCAYVGIILILFAPMMSPLGDIDYVVFTEEQKRAAAAQAMRIVLLGLIPLAVSGLSFFFSTRVARFILRFWPGGRAA